MATVEITENQILDALHRVPADRWSVVLGFLEQIAVSSPTATIPSRPIRVGSDVAASGLIGIWADRTDISNSLEFAQELRNQASQR